MVFDILLKCGGKILERRYRVMEFQKNKMKIFYAVTWKIKEDEFDCFHKIKQLTKLAVICLWKGIARTINPSKILSALRNCVEDPTSNKEKAIFSYLIRKGKWLWPAIRYSSDVRPLFCWAPC